MVLQADEVTVGTVNVPKIEWSADAVRVMSTILCLISPYNKSDP